MFHDLGTIKFTQLVRKYEKDDDDLMRLATEFKSVFMPPLATQKSGGDYDDDACGGDDNAMY